MEGAPSQNLPMVALPKYDSAGRGIVLEAIDREHGMDSPGAEQSYAHIEPRTIAPSICFQEYPEAASE
jgi:hypothetical protein